MTLYHVTTSPWEKQHGNQELNLPNRNCFFCVVHNLELEFNIVYNLGKKSKLQFDHGTSSLFLLENSLANKKSGNISFVKND